MFRPRSLAASGFAALVAVCTLLPRISSGYGLNGFTWPAGTTIQMQLGLGPPPKGALSDGFPDWNASAADALASWNQNLVMVQYGWTINENVPHVGGDNQNAVYFDSTIYGEAFGANVLAVTTRYTGPFYFTETDTIFNTAFKWDSYRGPLIHNNNNYTYDFHRVALHEFGHTLGLAHPDDFGQNVVAIMNSVTSDLDHLADDDIAGVQFLYGLRITSQTNPFPSNVGEDFRYQITATNLPTSYSATGLPSGLTLDSTTGLIGGVPTVSGTFQVTINAIGSRGTATAIITITISPPVIYSLISGPAWVGNTFSFRIAASSHPTSYDAANLPDGFQIDPQTGIISGFVRTAGDFTVQLFAHTPYGEATSMVVFHFYPAQVTSFLYEGIYAGNQFVYQITSTLLGATFEATGLPDGFSVDPKTGIITGTATNPGRTYVTLIAHGGVDVSAQLTIDVLLPDITFTHPYSNVIGSPTSWTVTAQGGSATFSATGLPRGMSIDPATGTISGIPTLSGNYSFTITAHTGYGDASKTFQITITPTYLSGTPVASFPNLSARRIMFDAPRRRTYLLSDGLIVIDTQTLQQIASVSLEGQMVDADISPDGNILYVAGGFVPDVQPAIARVDLNTLQRLPDLHPPRPAYRLRCGLNGWLYFDSNGTFIKLSATNMKMYATYDGLPISGLERSADGTKLFVADSYQDRMAVFDLSSSVFGPVQDVSPFVGNPFWDFVPMNSGQALAVTMGVNAPQNDGAIEVAGSDVTRRLGQFRGTLQPATFVYSPDGSRAYQLSFGSTNVDIFYTSSFGFIGQMHLEEPLTGGGFYIDPSGQYLFVVANGIRVYDLSRPPAVPSAPKTTRNVSTRVAVASGDEAPIAGFVIGGTNPKQVLIRGIGPSLARYGLNNYLPDPVLELHDSTGNIIATNDNWNSNRSAVVASGYSPLDEHEAAIVITLQPGAYTAVLHDYAGNSGIGLVEVYDLQPLQRGIVNLSTRGEAGSVDNVMIAGVVISGDQPTNVILRALGPTLTQFGVAGVLADPMLELHDSSGATIYQNDNWKSDQQQQIEDTGLAPPNDSESAILATLQPGNYTAIVRGANNSTGVALVEVYNLDAQ